MKITIRQDETVAETEITVVCRSLDGKLREIISELSLAENTIAGKKGEETFFIPLKDVYYFESVDDSIFAYTESNCYEISARLYLLEEKFKNTLFLRVSKSIIVNLKKMKSLKPEKNQRMCTTLLNGERIIISRQYIDDIKERLGV